MEVINKRNTVGKKFLEKGFGGNGIFVQKGRKCRNNTKKILQVKYLQD